MARGRRRRIKIRLSSDARLVHKNDRTRVAKQKVYPILKNTRPPADVAPTFRIKIRRR